MFRGNWLAFVLFFILSCDQQIEGEGVYILTSNSSSNPQHINRIEISGDSHNVSLIDSYGVRYSGEYDGLTNKILLNSYVTSPIVISNIDITDSTMVIDSCIYTKVSDSAFDSSFNISVVPIGSNNEIEFKRNRKRRTYPISIKSINETEYILKLGDRNTTIDELPLYMYCSHCEKVEKNAVIFIDQNVRLEHLFEVYQCLDRQAVRNRQVVTGVHEVGVYEGFRDRITIWQEQRDLFASRERNPYPPQIGAYRKSWVKSEDVCLIDGNEVLNSVNVSAIRQNFNCAYVLINLYDIEFAVEYLKLREIVNSQIKYEDLSKDGDLNEPELNTNHADDTLPETSNRIVYEYYGSNKVNK